jgi:hypothetical protein
MQSVADQLRAGRTTVTIGGTQYPINNAAYRNQIMAGYPAPPSQPPVTVSAPPPGVGTEFPEAEALKQMAQIDPASEALRQQLARSYATPLTQAGGPPSAAALQSYLDLYKSLDPQTFAAMQALGPKYQSYLESVGGVVGKAQQEAALGAALDPSTRREIEQATRAAQGARGNVYGTPQMVEEAMTRGQAGMAIQRQRQQDYLQALGAQQGGLGAYQSYLTSGFTPGATAFGLYQQNLGNLRQAQQAAQSYLASGQTPYAAGAGYLGAAQQAGAAASAGGPQYQPAALSGSPYSYMNPNYGLSMGQLSNQWYQNLAAYGGQGSARNPWASAGMGAAGGALSGAATGATMGTVAGVPGWIVGGALGAIGGGLSGYAG